MNLKAWKKFYQTNEYSFLTPVSKALDCLFNGETVAGCEKLFGFHSAMTHKLMFSKVLQEDKTINIGLANRIYIFGKLLSFNHDLVFSEITSYKLETDVDAEQYPTKKLMTLLGKKYNEARLLKIFFNHRMDDQEIEDLDVMLKKSIAKSSEAETLSLLPDKPKHFIEIHDALDIALSNFSATNTSLKQREDIIKMDGEKILNNLMIKVPRSHYDLVKLGNQLNFCIGNGSYTERVNQGKISIISIFKDGKPIYGIEFNRYSIKQARGFGNSVLSKELLSALEQVLIKDPVLPEDFIKIEHHPFIYGYKYNNTDLFMMLKGGGIYIYHNMSRNIYDGLVASEAKGKYFHQNIKPNKNFSKKEAA